MTDTAMTSAVVDKLNAFIDKNLPLMGRMGVEIESYDGKQLKVGAPMALNHNDKGTAFGGSLYCLCVLNAIGLLFLKCFERGLDPDLVVSHAEIDYQQPVKDIWISASAESPPDDVWDAFFAKYAGQGKAGIRLGSIVAENNETAVIFEGRFAIIGET